VNQYLNQLLLVLSVIAAPMILGALVYFGVTMTERRRRSGRTDRSSDSVAIGGKRRRG